MRKIMFDAFELVHGAGKSMGIYNYALNLVRALPAELPEGWTLEIACNPVNAADFKPDHPRATQVIHGEGAPSKVARMVWIKWGAPRWMRAHGIEVYLSPKGFLPGLFRKPRGVKTIVAVHDMIPLWYQEHYPKQFNRLEQMIVIRGLLQTVRNSDIVMTHSQAARDDIARRSARREGIHAFPSGFPVSPPGPAPMAGPFLFSTGYRLPHKNTKTILEGYRIYRQLAQNPMPLVITGIDDPHIEGVTVLSGLSNEALHGCYAHAHASIFLSLAEGFGYPPLESLVHGTPLIVSDLPVFRETTRGAAVYVDPLDPQAVARQLMNISTDMQLVERLRKAGPEVAAHYTWQATARGVAALMAQMR